MKLPISVDSYREELRTAAGIDEAGRGPLAGPVVAACVLLDETREIAFLDDSKKLSEKKRMLLFDEIQEKARGFGVGIVSPLQIDEMNVLRASLFAMKLALDDLLSKSTLTVPIVLVDGNQRAPLSGSVSQITVVGGDAIYPAIMAASILAKVTRDRIMDEMDSKYPGYGFSENKGYGTSAHLAALKSLGPTPIHRMTFAPLKKELMHERTLFELE